MPLHVFGDRYHVEILMKAGAVGFTFGQSIRFKGGILSPGAYINNRVLRSHVAERTRVIRSMSYQLQRVAKSFDMLADVATGGTMFASMLAHELLDPLVSVKKAEKGHGIGGIIDGDISLVRGARIMMVEDMSSTFESTLRAMEPLERAGGIIAGVIMVNTWNLPQFQQNAAPYTVYTLMTGEHILDVALEKGLVDTAYGNTIRQWLNDPADEGWCTPDTWKKPRGE